MPILNDILDHEVLGREYKKGLREGLEEGQEKGERALLSRLMEKRFGAVPAPVEQLLSGKSLAELVDLGVRLLDATISTISWVKHSRRLTPLRRNVAGRIVVR